jgi:signal peptidase I
MIRLIKKLVLIVITLFLIHTYIGSMFIYYNNNMFPSIRDGDLCFIEKYDKHTHIDDIILYNNTLYRVIARENQEVNITEKGILTVDGQQVLSVTNSLLQRGEITYPIKLKQGELFVLNDYREEISDSREFNTIQEKDIAGKIFFLIRRRGF